MRRSLPCLLVVLLSAGALTSQTLTRRAATIDALRTYPGFFHLQPVVLHGDVRRDADRASLVTEGGVLRLTSREALPEGPGEIRGVLYDVGRLTLDDPRLITLDLHAVFEREYGNQWPRPGEELVLLVSDILPLAPPPSQAAPPLRAVVLSPERFLGERISVVGQFRGRNLFGDLPAGPGVGRWDFVLRSADAAIWVAGQRPRGRGFDLDVARRMDTGRWLRVTGTVARGRGLVWIEATTVAAADDPGEEAVEVQVPAPPPAPLEVIFTSPRDGESGTPGDARIRLQFSRDLAAESIDGQLRLAYGARPGEPDTPQPIPFKAVYTPASRGVEIVPVEPLAPYRTVIVEVLSGLTAHDGTPVTPFILRFQTGG